VIRTYDMSMGWLLHAESAEAPVVEHQTRCSTDISHPQLQLHEFPFTVQGNRSELPPDLAMEYIHNFLDKQ
jgi:hypothetical protein